jgi:DNA-binding response OmpR family regulator
MSRILLVEDNDDLAFAITEALELEGYEVDAVGTGPLGVEAAMRGGYALIILDLMLPGFDGFRALRLVREAGSTLPVLILTALGAEDDKVRGFRLGADDYLTKPFGIRELLARVEALLRRARASDGGAAARPPATIMRFGEVEVNTDARLVRRRGQPVALRPKEYDLLMALIAREGKVVKRQDLLRELWQYSEDVTTRTVDIHIAELRRKIEESPGEPKHIITVWKVGYRFER